MTDKNPTVVNNKNRDQQLEKLKWQFALENSSIGIWDYNATTDTVFFSKESKQILGYTNEDTDFHSSTTDWNNRVHPEDREKYFKDFKDHINGVIPIYENEYRILCKDGTYKWILDKGKIISKDISGNALRVIGTHIDITERVLNQKNSNRTLNLVTKQNEKLENFAHIVTHNLKEHSGNFESILGFYNQAEKDSEKEELISYLETLSTSLKNTIKSLTQIVSVQSRKERTIEKLNICKYIERVSKVLDVIIEKNNAKINNQIDKNLEICFSPAYLESIIQNLLSNAIKYKHPDRDPIIILSSEINNESIIIKITDNGIGIDLKKFGNAVFGLYKTFHRNEDSEGVGLYLVKSQIESFGGKIDISSIVNTGTTFTITIPNKKNQLN